MVPNCKGGPPTEAALLLSLGVKRRFFGFRFVDQLSEAGDNQIIERPVSDHPIVLGRGAAVTFGFALVVEVPAMKATRSYVSRFRLGGLCAIAPLVEGQVEATWLPLVGASLLRKDVLQGTRLV